MADPSREWTFTVLAPAPWVNENELRSGDRKKKINQTRWIALWRGAGCTYARNAGLRASRVRLQQVEVDVVVVFPADSVTRDSPNTYPSVKAVIDGALVDTGVLPDDNDRHLRCLCIRPGPPMPHRPYGPAGQLHVTVKEVVSGGGA